MNLIARLKQRAQAGDAGTAQDPQGISLIQVPSQFIIVECPFDADAFASLPAAQALADALDASDQRHGAALRDMHDELL
jgi:hypothetical protein